MPRRYRQEVEAVQWNGDNFDEVEELTGADRAYQGEDDNGEKSLLVIVRPAQGADGGYGRFVTEGYWVVRQLNRTTYSIVSPYDFNRWYGIPDNQGESHA